DIKRMDYPWLAGMASINRNFFIEDYSQATRYLPPEKIVVVQGACMPGQFLEEVAFIREQALQDNRIQGIVAYAPLEDPRLADEALQTLSAIPLVKGIRRMYDDDPSLCCSAPFIAGLQKLPARDLSFDISILPSSMKATIRMIEKCPETRFILDHLGKPSIVNSKLDEFKQNMAILSSFPNVAAKISGLVTEADLEKWTGDDIMPYLEYALNRFGFERLMFGSDWPVMLLASSYEKWVLTVMRIIEGCTNEEKNRLFYTNAEEIYNLI
ncbi:MAG TPA: amidohydrolase family protein, partial [Puia sp.]|nr:amidohydrolase family protein [Puia sp.]